MTDPVVEETVKGHKRLERNITLLAIGTFVTVAIGGLVQITPLFYLDNTIEEVEGVRPYTPLEQAGRDAVVLRGGRREPEPAGVGEDREVQRIGDRGRHLGPEGVDQPERQHAGRGGARVDDADVAEGLPDRV